MRGARAAAAEGPTTEEQFFFGALLIVMLLCVFRSLACVTACSACRWRVSALTHMRAPTAAQEQQGGRRGAQP